MESCGIDVATSNVEGICAAVAACCSATVAVLMFLLTVSNGRNTKKERILKLYEEYHRPEFYGKIRAPFYEIGEKWNISMNGDKEYAKVLLGADNLSKEFRPLPQMPLCKDKEQEHVLEPITFVGLTEHQTLTIGLGFWTTLYMLYSEKLIDRKLIQIFGESYGYDRDFIADLRIHFLTQLVKDKYLEEGVIFDNTCDEIEMYEEFVENLLPSWYNNTKKLDNIFDKLTFKANKKKERKRNLQKFFRRFPPRTKRF